MFGIQMFSSLFALIRNFWIFSIDKSENHEQQKEEQAKKTMKQDICSNINNNNSSQPDNKVWTGYGLETMFLNFEVFIDMFVQLIMLSIYNKTRLVIIGNKHLINNSQ